MNTPERPIYDSLNNNEKKSVLLATLQFAGMIKQSPQSLDFEELYNNFVSVQLAETAVRLQLDARKLEEAFQENCLFIFEGEHDRVVERLEALYRQATYLQCPNANPDVVEFAISVLETFAKKWPEDMPEELMSPVISYLGSIIKGEIQKRS